MTTDGKIQVYEFSDGNASCLKTIEAMAAPGKPEWVDLVLLEVDSFGAWLNVSLDSVDSDELPCAVAWHPKGDFFVVPTRSHGE